MSVPIVVDAIGAVVDVDNVPCVLCLLPVGLPLARALSPTRIAAISCNSPAGLLVHSMLVLSVSGRWWVHSVGRSLVLSMLVLSMLVHSMLVLSMSVLACWFVDASVGAFSWSNVGV